MIWWWCLPIPSSTWLQWLHYWGDLGQNIHRNWNIGDGSVGDNHGCGVYGDDAILTILAMKTLALTRRAVLTTIAAMALRLNCHAWSAGDAIPSGPRSFMLEIVVVVMMTLIVYDVWGLLWLKAYIGCSQDCLKLILPNIGNEHGGLCWQSTFMLEMVVVKMMMISDDWLTYLRLALTESALVTLNALKIVRLEIA